MSHHIKALLAPFIQSNKVSWKVTLLREWHNIMGNLADHVSIEKIHEDVIVLGVQDASWLQELYLLSGTILETINQNLDQPRFKSIRFKQKGRTAKKKEKKIAPEPQKIHCIHFSKHEQDALNAIQNNQLRDALRSFLIRCHQERKR